MTNLRRIERDYHNGRITDVTAGWQILGSLTEKNQGELDLLCADLRFAVADTIECIVERRGTTSDIRPTEKQVELGKKWLNQQEPRSPTRS